ncbi:MAG: tRNA pseudouridine(55) synthase TruB [Bacteroidota bacterium]
MSDLPIVTAGRPLPSEPGYALPVDKPPGLTSFGVIRRLRRFLGVKKIGHAGTLDPMATGLLICLVGRPATREQDRFMGLPKEYSGTLRLGETTASYDAETAVEARTPLARPPDEGELEAARRQFLGEIEQVPPVYSAIKQGGERLYKKARRGESVEVKARRVTVTAFDLGVPRQVSADTFDLDFEVACSKGTYIRSLAHDLGQVLGVGAHLVALRREAIGPHRVAEAWTLDALQAATEVPDVPEA